MVDVRGFGAFGDGVTDNTARLQALFDAIGADGPRSVYFPPGRYLHSGLSVVGKSGFEIHGPGELVATEATVTEYLAFEGCTDFTVEGLGSTHQNPTARRSSPARAFSFTNCTGFRVSGCHAHHGEGVGIMLNHCAHATVTANRVDHTKADGIGLYGGTHHVAVTGNTTWETGDDGIAQVGVLSQGVRPHHNTITGNTVCRSHARGIVAVGAHDTTITGNTVDTTRAGGIYIASEPTRGTYGCTNIVASSNTVSGANTYEPAISQAGVFVLGYEEPVEGVTVMGNMVTGSRCEGIRVGGSGLATYRVNITGNTVEGSGATGIALWAVEHLIVTGNIVTGSGAQGISGHGKATGVVHVSGNIEAGNK